MYTVIRSNTIYPWTKPKLVILHSSFSLLEVAIVTVAASRGDGGGGGGYVLEWDINSLIIRASDIQ